MLAEAVFKNWEHLTGGGTKCQMDFPTSSLINNHLLEATRLDPSLAEEKKAVTRMVVENLYIMGSTEDEDRKREEIQTRLERDRRRLARLKLPKCPAQVSDTWRAATGLPFVRMHSNLAVGDLKKRPNQAETKSTTCRLSGQVCITLLAMD
jgi:hypothetical protein